jgi:hypothetical protein
MWWFSEIDRNRVTVLVNDVELTNIELSEATIRKATLAVENAETNKARLDASVELKQQRLEAVIYLKVFYYFKI